MFRHEAYQRVIQSRAGLSVEERFRHVRPVCGNRSFVRVAPDFNVYGDEAISGSIALSSRRDGTKTRAPGLSAQRPGTFSLSDVISMAQSQCINHKSGSQEGFR